MHAISGRGPALSKREVKPTPVYMTHSTLRKRAQRDRLRPMFPAQQFGPKASTLNAILSYSKALKVVEVPPVGAVDIVLN